MNLMTNTNTPMQQKVHEIAFFNEIEVYQIETNKFKTNTINIFFHDDLTSEEKATKNALIPAVLRRGCRRFPEFKEIAIHLEELYGTVFDCGVSKKGEMQIIQFYSEFVSDKYTANDNTNLFEKVFQLLYEIITDPVTENGVFKEQYVQQEKENLKKLIESRTNDKVQYAVDRCYEEMCKNEPFSIYDYGSVSQLQHINSNNLYQHYKLLLDTFPVRVYITGDISQDRVKWMTDMLKNLRKTRQNGDVKIFGTEMKHASQQIHKGPEVNVDEYAVKNIVEKMNINQGKLSLGFRTNTSPCSEDYYKMVLYNCILGGGVHSKLFRNVREKEGLAYYVFSRLEKFKGLMLISSGIELQNKEQAVKIILREIKEISDGNISENEYISALKTIETGVKSLKDSQLQMVDFYLSQIIAGTKDDFNTFIEKIKEVAIKDVVDVSHKIRLDTVYFLTADSKENEYGHEKKCLQEYQ